MERLQKLLAQAGIASRRRAEEMILAGRVRVNGSVVTELGAQADPEQDTILVDNQPVAIESKAYYVLNKPRGYISDRDDTADNKTALDLVPDGRRLFSAGRLDLMSEGMLLLTNDGELANRLTHPRYEHEKEYLALVYGVPDDKAMERLERGILYDGEWLRADSAERASRNQPFGEAGRDETWLRLVLHEGKKRQIRHMCAALGHPVKRLIRVRIGPLVLGTMKTGEWRKLTREEVAELKERSQVKARGRMASGRKWGNRGRDGASGERKASGVKLESSNVRRGASEGKREASNVKRQATSQKRGGVGAKRETSNVKRRTSSERGGGKGAERGALNVKREASNVKRGASNERRGASSARREGTGAKRNAAKGGGKVIGGQGRKSQSGKGRRK